MHHIVAPHHTPSLRHHRCATPLFAFKDGTIIGRRRVVRHVVASSYHVVASRVPHRCVRVD
jgi:hypothetical protein